MYRGENYVTLHKNKREMAVNVMVNVTVKQNIIGKKDAPLKLHSDATKCCYNTLFLD